MTTRSAEHIDALLANVGWVRSLARQLCADAHAAEDAVQATLAAAVQHPPRRAGSLRAYLARLLRNTLSLAGRSAARRARRERAARAANDVSSPSACELVERAELQQRVVAAVLALPEKWRELVLQHWFEGEDVSAIAARTGRTQDAVRALLRRARERLRRDLERRGELRALAALVAPAGTGAMTLTQTAVAGGILMQGKLLVCAVAVLTAVGIYCVVGRGEGLSQAAPVDSGDAMVVSAAGAANREAPVVPAVAPPERAAAPALRTAVRGRLIGLHARLPWRAQLTMRAAWLDGVHERSREAQIDVDGDGGFVFDVPWTDTSRRLRVRLSATADGYEPLAASHDVAPGSGQELQVQVVATPVLFGQVVDPAGIGVGDAQVMVFAAAAGVPTTGARAQTTTAADGTFVVRVESATDRLVAALPPAGRADVVPVARLVADGSIVLELAPMRLAPSSLVTGAVQWTDGRAVTRAEVEWRTKSAVVLDQRMDLGWRSDGTLVRRIKVATDASGRFELPVGSGENGVVLLSSAEGCLPPEFVLVRAVAPQEVALSVPGRPVRFEVLADGQPAGRAGVEWRRPTFAGNYGTDEHGVLQLLVLDESMRVRAVDMDRARSSEWHEFPQGPPDLVVLELLPEDGVPIVIVPEGVALARVSCRWQPADGGAVRSTLATAVDGRFPLRMPAGSYRLGLQGIAGTSSQYLLPREHDVVVPASGGELRVPVVLGGRFRLTATDGAGAFVAGRYRLLRDGVAVEQPANARIDARGPHESTVLPDGEYTVVVDFGERGERRLPVTVVAGQTAELRVHL